MSTAVLSGKPLAGLFQQEVQDQVRSLERDGVRPVVAVVMATADESTRWYVRSIERAAERAGIGCRIIDLGHDATEPALARVLREVPVSLNCCAEDINRTGDTTCLSVPVTGRALRRRGRGPAGRAGNARPTLRTPRGPA